MPVRIPSSQRNPVVLASLGAAIVFASLVLIPAACGAQSSSPSDTQDPLPSLPNDTAPVKRKVRKTPEPPPPTNPLVKVNPSDGSGNDVRELNTDGTPKPQRPKRDNHYGDYQSGITDPRSLKKIKALPLFGYDYFVPARRLIEAKEATLLQRYHELMMANRPATRKRTTRANRTGPPQNSDTINQDGKDTSDRMRTDSVNTQDNTDNDTATRPRRTLPEDRTDGRDSSSTDNPPDSSDAEPSPDKQRGAQDGQDTTATGDNSDRSMAQDSAPRDQSDSNSTQEDRSGSNGYDNRDSTLRSSGSDYNAGTASEEELQAQDRLQRSNARRALLGLSPLPADRTDNSLSGRNNSDYSSTNSLNRNRYLSDQGNNYSSNGTYRSDTDNSMRDLQPVDAFNMVADPLTLMTRNVIASVPTTYVLSGGDRVIVRYSNPATPPREMIVTVDPQGYLALSEAGRVSVAGMSLAQAEKSVTNQLAHYYRNVTVSLSYRELRTVPVTVSGNAFRPGTYLVPAVASVFNVLYSAGGPNVDGSLRNIEVRRQGKRLPFDFYTLMAAAPPHSTGSTPGHYAGDMTVQAGDDIYIPGADQRVSLMGAVHTPARYELKDGESLQDALAFAGGVKATGISHSLQVTTLEPGVAHVIENVDLKDTAHVSHLQLYDGDVVNVLTLRPVVTNMVTINGAVNQPSDYKLSEGMKVRDLLRAARDPLPEAFLGRAALYRWNPNNTTTLVSVDLSKVMQDDPDNNLVLKPWDRLEIYTRQQAAFVGTRKVIVRGAVARPGDYAYSANMHASDLLLKVGGPMPDAEMVVVEHQHGDGTKQYETVSVADLVGTTTAKDVRIEDNDIVAVYRNGETQYIPNHRVTVRGAVQSPGIYDRGEGMRLSSLLQISGGFLPDAGTKVVIAHARRPVDTQRGDAQSVAVLFDSRRRCVGEDLMLQDGDEVLVQGKGGFEDHPRIVTIKGQVNTPGPVVITDKTRLSEVIKMAGGLRPQAFPEGAQLLRDPKNLALPEQKEVARIISDLNDLNNESAYKRELAKSDLERIKAAGTAQNSSALPIGNQPSAGNPATAALAIELSKHDLVSRPRVLADSDLAPNGNIAIDLPAALSKPQGTEDILMADGDTISIPEMPTTIQVVGAVVNQRGVKFQQGAGLMHYIDAAGGFAPDVAKDRIVVIHAGGGLTPAAKVRALRPGDLIFVPTRVMSEKLSNGSNSFASFFQSLTSSAIIFKLATGVFGF